MKYSFMILLLAIAFSCSEGDKKREDFPNTDNEEHHPETRDSVTTSDTIRPM